MWICITCGHTFNPRLLNMNLIKGQVDSASTCPLNDCKGQIVQLDEFISPTILVLNQKGYTTTSSCSGHWDKRQISTYIVFDALHLIPSTIPEGFSVDGNRLVVNNQAIETYRTCKTNFERLSFIQRLNEILYRWAEKLPEYRLPKRP